MRRLVSVVALAIALVGVTLLVSTSNHYNSISKSKSITALSKVTYDVEEATASFTHAPTPSKFDDDKTRSPTPQNLHPTKSPVEEKNIKRSMKNFEETFQPTPTMFGSETFNPTPLNRNPSHSFVPTEEPSEKKPPRELKKGDETYNPTPKHFGEETYNPTPKGFPNTYHPTEEPSEKKIISR
jgi:hypothetical protein